MGVTQHVTFCLTQLDKNNTRYIINLILNFRIGEFKSQMDIVKFVSEMKDTLGHVKLINSCLSTLNCVSDAGRNYYLLIIIYYLVNFK